MSDDVARLNFSQRNGLQSIPEQLKLGEVSDEFRRLVHYALDKEINRVKRTAGFGSWFEGAWSRLAQDLHVKFFRLAISSFENDPDHINEVLEKFVENAQYDKLFNLIEFFSNHHGATPELRLDFIQVFVETRAAYRLKDNLVIAVGTDEQAQALLKALDETESSDNRGARLHLLNAGKNLANRDWVASVRDSIHAVEAAAVGFSPRNTDTLGPALKELERRGKLHAGLKKAFGALYGFSSDQKTGVRHANVFGVDDTVDETDALFMLGACASFVSYLIARNT